MSHNFKITLKRNKLTARHQYIIFPFTTGEYLSALSKTNLDYVLSPPPKTPLAPIGSVLDWSGTVGKKGNVSLVFDSLVQNIGVDGSDPIESLNVFSEILDIIKTSLEPKNDKFVNFYELISNYSVETGQSPLEKLAEINPEGGLYDKIQGIIQEPVSSYSLHVCSSGKKIESTDWFDIKIQPKPRNAEKTFDIMAIYRSKEKSKVDSFVTNIEEYFQKILAL